MSNQAGPAIVNLAPINFLNSSHEIGSAFRFGWFVFGLLSILGGSVQSDTLQQQRRQFVQAETALKSGNIAEYSELLKRLDHYPLVAYLRYVELYDTRDHAAVLGYLDRFDGSLYAKNLRKIYLRQLAAAGQWQKFVDLYREYDTTSLQCSYYRALYLTGSKAEALKGAQSLWLSGESRPDECDGLFELLRQSPSFSPDLAWQRFALALEKGNEGLAKYLQRFLAREDLAAARFALRVHSDPGLISHCPGSHSTGRFDVWIFAHGVERMADTDLVSAISVWDARSASHSIDAETLHRVKRRLATLAALRRYPFAYSRFEGLNPEFTDQDTRFWRIRSALMTESWDHVRESIERLPEEEKAQGRWKYWLARAFQAQDRNDQAGSLFLEVAKEREYYGFLAADRLDLDYRYSDRPIVVDSNELARLEALPNFAVIREWLALGRNVEAKRNWWHMLNGLSQREKTLAAKTAEKWGLSQMAVFTAAQAEYWDDLRLRFPIAFTQPIMEYAKARGLPPTMVFGLVRQESVFDDQVVSGAGAIGLMQIMPATGRQIAREINEPWRSNRNLFDPDTNVRYGTHYLRNLLDKFGQNLALAAAGYNAGPHRVQRWLPVDKPLDSDIWVEIIPYRETRKYVRYVLGYMVVYQHRLQSGQKRLREFMPMVAPGNSAVKAGLPLRKQISCY